MKRSEKAASRSKLKTERDLIPQEVPERAPAGWAEVQKRLAEQSKAALEQSHRFKRVMPQIVPETRFWRGEEYHQHFYKTHAVQYRRYRVGCGRDARLRELWGRGN